MLNREEDRTPVGRLDFKSSEGLQRPWWVRLPRSFAKYLFCALQK